MILKRILLNSLIVKDYTLSFPPTAWFIRTKLRCDRCQHYDFYEPEKGTYPGFDVNWAAITPYIKESLVNFRNPIWKTYHEKQNLLGGGYQGENWIDLPAFIASFQKAIHVMKTPSRVKCELCDNLLPYDWDYTPKGDPSVESRIYFTDMIIGEVKNKSLVNRDLKYEHEIAEDKLNDEINEFKWKEYLDYCKHWLHKDFYINNEKITLGYFNKGQKVHESKGQLGKRVPGRVTKPMELYKVEEIFAKPVRNSNSKKAYITSKQEAKKINKPNLAPRIWNSNEIANFDEEKLADFFPELRASRCLDIAEFEGEYVTHEEFHDTSVKLI